MKRTHVILFTAVAGMASFGGPTLGDADSPADVNWMPNPDLQGAGSSVVEWHWDTRAGQYQFRHHPEGGPEGAAAISIEGTESPPDGWARWYVDAFLLEGVTYQLTAQVQMAGAGSGDLWLPNVFQTTFQNVPEWTEQRTEFVAPATGSTRFYFQIHGPGHVWFARPALRLVRDAPPVSGEPVPAEGGDLVKIVIGPAPGPVEISCALELRRIFQAITGKKAAIGTGPAPGRCLYVGCGPDEEALAAELAKLGPEGTYLRVTPEAVVCAGRTPRGTYYAVQELLYRLGCRWIWPGTYGECLPPGGPLALPGVTPPAPPSQGGERILAHNPALSQGGEWILAHNPTLSPGGEWILAHNPSFELRGGTIVQVEARPGGTPEHVPTDAWVDWGARNCMNRLKASYAATWNYGVERGYGWEETSGHTVTELLLPASEFEKHPDYFALYHGQRVGVHPIGTVAEPCVSNPVVIDRFTQIVREYFASHPQAKRFFLGANDEPSYWCECDHCKALDVPPVDWSKNGKESLPLTDRWLYLVNTVAERIEPEFPDRWIGTFAYASTAQPPRKRRPRRNVMIEWTAWEHCRKHRFLDRACPVNAQGLAQLRKWLKVAPAVSIYSYLDYRYMEIPEPFLASDEDFYRTLHGLGVRHVADELDTTPYASPVLLGLRARLLWDVNTHAEDYLDRFCRIAYGDAAEDMKQFWQFQEQAVRNSPTAHPTVNDLARYTPTVLLRSKRLLRQALDRPLTDVTSPSSLIPHPSSLTAEQRARVERAWMSLLFAEFYVAQEKAPSGDMAVWERLARSKRQILDLARRYGFTLNLYAHNALGGNYELPLAALGGKTLVSLPDEWLFRTDPEGRGEQERWFDPAAKLDSFRPISTSKNWEAQWVGAYDGTAWYVTEVIIPATEVKHVWLLFGAVDETWKVWLNGDYIGASTGDPGEIWDKPTAIEITGKYPSGQKVRLVVKVHDIGYAGGIWRPVRITASD